MYIVTGKKEECTGCGACAEVCPNACITMQPDENGFLYPVVNSKLCINCKMCEKVCPYNNIGAICSSIKSCQYAVNSDKKVTDNSTSGGIFFEIAKLVIEDGGIVFGATWSDHYKLSHKVADSLKELEPLMGSKYVQSDCKCVFPLVKKSLQDSRKVLFVGTPCQVAGLKRYIGHDDENLLVIDIICHGVPSQKIFDSWIEEVESGDGKIVNLKFRDKKKYGWQHCITYDIEINGQRRHFDLLPAFNSYYYLFLKGYILRDSCYHCQYACHTRVGDITLGDYWGAAADKSISYSEMNSGVSLVLCNTEKGRSIVNRIQGIKLKECDLDTETRRNIALKTAVQRPNNRDEILALGSVNEMYKQTISRKTLLKENIKRLLPRKVYYFVSGCISGRR